MNSRLDIEMVEKMRAVMHEVQEMRRSLRDYWGRNGGDSDTVDMVFDAATAYFLAVQKSYLPNKSISKVDSKDFSFNEIDD